MLRFISLSITLIFTALASNAQSVSFSPEMVLGHRSLSYQHFVSYSFDEKWSVNNVSSFDTEYNNETNNIFFIRNTLSYSFNKRFKINAAIGIKNPGAFASIASEYNYMVPNFKVSYAIGSIYQNGFTLAQTLILNYAPTLSKSIQGYLNIFLSASTDLKILSRGIQQFRIGIKKGKLMTGIAVNLDQFAKAETTLMNNGFFIKYNF
jgi:hypothetical protein